MTRQIFLAATIGLLGPGIASQADAALTNNALVLSGLHVNGTSLNGTSINGLGAGAAMVLPTLRGLSLANGQSFSAE